MLIKLLLIENNLRSAMQVISLLDQLKHIKLCGVATCYEQGIDMIKQQQPNIVLLELSKHTERCFHLSTSIKQHFPHIHIIVFTRYDYAPFYNQLIESGVSGMLYKNSSTQDLASLLYNVLRGNTVVPLNLFWQMKLHRSESVKPYWEIELNSNEKHLLDLISKRYTNAMIAQKIHVSESSVEKYLRKLYSKLGVRNKNQVIERIKRDHLLRPIVASDSLVTPTINLPLTEAAENEHL